MSQKKTTTTTKTKKPRTAAKSSSSSAKRVKTSASSTYTAKTVKNTRTTQTARSASAKLPNGAKQAGASRKRRRKPKRRLRLDRLIALAVAGALLIGAGVYVISRFQLIDRVQQVISGGDRQTTIVRHDKEIAEIKKKNALDTVDGVSAFSDEELRSCFYSEPISDKIDERLKNMGYEEQIPKDDLRYVRVLFMDFEGKTEVGELVVNKDIATKIENVFYDLYIHRYPIGKMILPDAYGTRISESFADNNTVGLCFGLSDGSSGAVHEEGYAIDLNPLFNPLIKDNGSSLSVFPMEGQLYLDRTIQGEHYIYEDDYAVKAFEKEGFDWKGDEQGMNDYKHFEYPHASSRRNDAQAEDSEQQTDVQDEYIEDPAALDQTPEYDYTAPEDPVYDDTPYDPGYQDPGIVDQPTEEPPYEQYPDEGDDGLYPGYPVVDDPFGQAPPLE